MWAWVTLAFCIGGLLGYRVGLWVARAEEASHAR